jgi:CPA2 family monovalent cation:H+ antiporter-2
VHSTLYEILGLLLVSVIMVAGFKRISLPPILGYIVVGIVMGPHALGFIANEQNIHFLAEFGIVFMLFAIGLEFSIPQFLTMRRTMLGLGSLQVIISMIVFGFIAYAVGVSWQVSLLAGGALAMSSTAVVLKQLNEQSEMQSRHGRNALGILLFQDFAAIPLLIIIPVLGANLTGAITGENTSMSHELTWALAKGIFAIAMLLVIGRTLLRPLFHEIARAKSNELFTLTVLMVAIAAAALTSSLGLSMALGAFIAGMMLAETEFRHQVESDIRPFQDVLLGLFFITIGILIDLGVVWHHLGLILLLTLGLILLKALVVGLLEYGFGNNAGVALRTALVLAHGGEFGFALLSLMFNQKLLPELEGQVLLAAAIFSMMLSPILIKYNGKITKKLMANSYNKDRQEQELVIANESVHLDGHVLICGFGRVGQTLARFLKKAGIPYIALDMDIARITEAKRAGELVYYGDSSRKEILHAAGIDRAKLVVLSISDFHTSLKTLYRVREMRRDIQIMVRTRDEAHLSQLMDAGATEVIPDTFEASMMLSSQVLLLMGHSPASILREVRKVRQSRYSLLQGFYPGESDEAPSIEKSTEILHSIILQENSDAVGKELGVLLSAHRNIEVEAIKRDGIRGDDPEMSLILQAGDIIVARGIYENINHFEQTLMLGN